MSLDDGYEEEVNLYPAFPHEPISVGILLEPAMRITDPELARHYFQRLVEYAKYESPDLDEATIIEHVKENLGYFAGYYNDITREQVEELFDCAHPIFGKITERKWTADEVFKKGLEWAERIRNRDKELI